MIVERIEARERKGCARAFGINAREFKGLSVRPQAPPLLRLSPSGGLFSRNINHLRNFRFGREDSSLDTSISEMMRRIVSALSRRPCSSLTWSPAAIALAIAVQLPPSAARNSFALRKIAKCLARVSRDRRCCRVQ